jgi:hypothetical protein
MMKKKFAAALLAASLPALAFAQAPAQAPLPNVSPAMWVVKDADTTVYLFGTVHALDGKRDWFNDEVKTAFDSAEEVVFEIRTPDPAAAAPIIMQAAATADGKTLTSRLKPEQAKLLADELAKVGAPANALDNFDPWFAAVQLVQIRLMKIGVKPEHGAETILEAAAKSAGKSIGAVETFEWQIGLFDTLSAEAQLTMLTSYLDDLDEGDAMFSKMVDHWSGGKVEDLAALMNEALSKDPELAKKLLEDRNAKWAEWIGRRMDKPGTVFMAVGAGHLAGKGSVQDFLAKKGLKAERVKS